MLDMFMIALAAQVEVAMRLAEKEEADRQAIAELVLPGFDASDASVVASAAHFCGTTDDCKSTSLAARNEFVREAAVNGRKKQVLQFLKENAVGGFTNWREATKRYHLKYDRAPIEPLFVIRTTCRTYNGKHTSYTSCTTY